MANKLKSVHFHRRLQGTPSHAKNLPFVSHASMAKSPNSKSKPHLFLSCFGFSGKLRRFKPIKSAAGHNKRPFSWIKFHAKPPPAVHSTSLAKQSQSKADSDRLALRSAAPATAYKSSNEDFAVALPVATNQAGEERPEEVKNDVGEEKIIFENGQHSNSPKKPADQSQYSRFSLTRKLESFRSGRFTQPASPTVKKNPKPTAISHSFSFPPPNPARMSRVKEASASMRVGLKNGETSKKYRSTAAMSILIITLAIMVLWGKLCAILCTATWIFLIASLRSIVEEDDDAIGFIESDSYSQGFKKKLVVLKGFLYRNQREKLLKKL